MSDFVRACPFCGSEDTSIESEFTDIYGTDLHIMLTMKCGHCGEEFVAEDDYELTNSATGKDPDDLLKNLEKEAKE